MKILSFTLLLTIFSLYSLGQSTTPHPFKNDLKRQKLKGNVLTVTETDYNASGDSMQLKSVTKYNDKGNKSEFFTYLPTGAILSKTTFTYNDSDKLVEENRYKADGSLNVRTTCRYDDRGNKTEEYNYDISGTMFLKILNKYDGKGNRIVKDSYNEFGALFLKCNSKFDDDGNEIIAKEFDSHKGLQFTITYDYENSDNNGNWQKRTTYKNDEPFSITLREITYH
jgi:hypothetical protein